MQAGSSGRFATARVGAAPGNLLLSVGSTSSPARDAQCEGRRRQVASLYGAHERSTRMPATHLDAAQPRQSGAVAGRREGRAVMSAPSARMNHVKQKGTWDYVQSIGIDASGGMMSSVSAKQLVVTRSGADSALEAVDRTAGDSPWDYEDLERGTSVPRLGTQSLLAVAAAFVARGWRLHRIEVRKARTHEQVDDETEKFWLDAIRQSVSQPAGMSDSLVREVTSNVLVLAVTLRRPSSPDRLEIHRGGEVVAFGNGFDAYFEELREVWRAGTLK